MLGWLVERAVSIDTLHLDPRLAVQQPPSRQAPPTLDRRALFPHELQPPGRPTGHETRALNLLHEPFAASGRAHGRGGLGGVRTAKEKAGLLEGKLEDLVALKSAGRLVP